MNKGKIVVTLVALAVLAGLGAALWRPARRGLAQLWSPLPSPTLARLVEPTAPSEDWPTLTPPPTRGVPTPRGTPVVKPTLPPVPTPTRPSVLLTPIPEGTPPADLTWLYYVADTDAGPELRVIGMDTEGRRWTESQLAINRFPGNLVGLHLSPDDRYLALEFLGDGYGEVNIMERSSGRIWCPLIEAPTGCWGGFSGWTAENQFLFRPFDAPPEGVVPLGVIVVNLETGQYVPLDLPIQPKWGYSLARNVSPSPDGSALGYSITYSEGDKEISEVWTMRMDSGEKQLLRKVDGLVKALSWSPTGEWLLYIYQGKSGHLPTELRILSTDGDNEKSLATDLPMPGERRYRPVWSPDGHRIAFVQLDDPMTFYDSSTLWGNIRVVDITTAELVKLSTFQKRDVSYPTWSPDGRFVVFVSTGRSAGETLYSEVWAASADSRLLYPVSGMAKPYNALAWLPSRFPRSGDE